MAEPGPGLVAMLNGLRMSLQTQRRQRGVGMQRGTVALRIQPNGVCLHAGPIRCQSHIRPPFSICVKRILASA